MTLVWPVAAVPFLVAALLTFVPARAGAWTGFGGAMAFGLGGAAVVAGVFHLPLHTLAKAALLQGAERVTLASGGLWRTDRALAALVLTAGLGIAELPPAGVFASEFLVLADALRQAPGVALARVREWS